MKQGGSARMVPAGSASAGPSGRCFKISKSTSFTAIRGASQLDPGAGESVRVML